MNATLPGTQTEPPRPATKTLAQFRLIPRIETFPRCVSFAQTTLGRITVLAAFDLGLRFFLSDLFSALSLTFLLALMTFMPEYRRFILAVTPIAFVVVQTFQDPVLLSLNLAVIALGIFLYWCAMRWPKSWFGQRPISFLLAGFTVLILLACAAGCPVLACFWLERGSHPYT
jgi:hypothetical protein